MVPMLKPHLHQGPNATQCMQCAGEISPITRSLWFARHKLDQKVPEDSQPPVPVEKPPTETAVTYAFSTDAGLREQVSQSTSLQLRTFAALLSRNNLHEACVCASCG